MLKTHNCVYRIDFILSQFRNPLSASEREIQIPMNDSLCLRCWFRSIRNFIFIIARIKSVMSTIQKFFKHPPHCAKKEREQDWSALQLHEEYITRSIHIIFLQAQSSAYILNQSRFNLIFSSSKSFPPLPLTIRKKLKIKLKFITFRRSNCW